MKGLIGGRARLVATLVALVVLATASSCGGAGGGGGASASKVAKPVITPEQATGVVLHLEAQRVGAFGSENPAALVPIERDPVLTFDQEGIDGIKAQGSALTASSYESVSTMVPRQTAYPAWFMALAQVVGHNPALDLFVRSSPQTSWKLAVETGLSQEPAHWKKRPGGWAVATGLNVDPSRTLSAYWNTVISGASATGAGVAPGSMTSAIASQIQSDIATNKTRGWAQAAGFAAGGSLPEAIELADGGRLSFAWVIERLQTRDAYPYCFPQPASNGTKWDPLVPNGNYLEVDLTYTYLEGVVTPPNGALDAVSYAAGTTGADGQACPS